MPSPQWLTEILNDPVAICAFLFLAALAGLILRLEVGAPGGYLRNPVIARRVGARGEEIVVPTTGREVFTSAPLLAGRVYEITMAGIYSYKAVFQTWQADAFYDQDWRENFLQRHDGLYLDGKALRAWVHRVEQADRAHHRYVIHIDGTGHPLSIAVRPPRSRAGRGSLRATVTLLPETTPTLALLQRQAELLAAAEEVEKKKQEALATEAQRTVEEQRRRAETEWKAREEAALWEQRAERLTRETDARCNWEAPEFRRDYVANHAAALLHRRQQIVNEYVRFFQQEDPRFVVFLRQHYPSLVVRLTAEFEALLEVERLDAAKAPASPPPPAPPRRKPTVEEFRARLVERIRVATEDRKAVFQAVLVGKAELIQEIDGFELAEEERGQLLELIDAQMAPHLDQLVEGKEGTRGLAKILD